VEVNFLQKLCKGEPRRVKGVNGPQSVGSCCVLRIADGLARAGNGEWQAKGLFGEVNLGSIFGAIAFYSTICGYRK
jgi:hypothetical protein